MCQKVRPYCAPSVPPFKYHFRKVAFILGIGVKYFAYRRKVFWV